MMKHFASAGLVFGLLFLVACSHSRATVPSGGASISVSDDVPYVYICNETSATVTVVNSQTLEVVDTVDLTALGFDKNSKPHHVAVEPDGSYWYVSLIAAGKVLKMDRENNLVDSADFETPGMLALHPEEDLMFIGRSMKAVNPPQRVGMLERSSMEMDEVDVFFPRPHAIVIDPRGDHFYTASLSVNQFLSMNIESGDINLEKLEGDTHTFVQFALSPDGNTMVVGGQLTGKVLVFDTSNPGDIKLTDTIEVNAAPWHPTFTPDGKFVYIGNKMANTVTVIDMEKKEVEAVIEGEGLAQPHGIGVSPDGKYVFVSNNNTGGMMMMNMGGGDKEEMDHSAHTGHQMEEEKEEKPGTLVVIDTATNTIAKVIELDMNSTGLGITMGR